jgi:hypothetical protein
MPYIHSKTVFEKQRITSDSLEMLRKQHDIELSAAYRLGGGASILYC